MRRQPPTSTLFPYTTLFRSAEKRPPPVQRLPVRVFRPPLRQQPAAPLVPLADLPQLRQDFVVQPDDSLLRAGFAGRVIRRDRKSTRLNSSHPSISYAVFCLK